ncbi:hypothetical protein BJX99DRAFT_268744 [Aspergillus californicus]
MRGCLTCRQRHLKCDKTGGECLRCQRSGRQCVPAPAKSEELTFRHGQNPSIRSRGPPRYGESDLVFPVDQYWIQIPPEVSFEDETEQTASEYHVVSEEASPTADGCLETTQSVTSPATLPSISSPNQAHSRGDSESSRIGSQMQTDVMEPGSTRVVSGNHKLETKLETYLLRHFQKSLGPWFDSCDHDNQFSMNVVERACSTPLLLHACLAASARHLSFMTTCNFPPSLPDEYHEKCIAILLSILGKWESQMDIEALLASTVILRFFEQISCYDPSHDLRHHLLAGSVYFNSHVTYAVSDGLAGASFWVYVMQDVQSSLVSQIPLRITLGTFNEKLQLRWTENVVQTDRDWAHQAIWLLAETINHCYGVHDSQESTINRAILLNKIFTWEMHRPDSFRPLHSAPANSEIGILYPYAVYTITLHAIAIQHICLAKALIRDHEIRSLYTYPINDVIENLSVLFGIALSGSSSPPLFTMACHALCACSAWVRDGTRQKHLMEFILYHQKKFGWPSRFLLQRLSREWHVSL